MATHDWIDIGSDTRVADLDERVTLVSVHMSNNEEKFIKQKQKLAGLIAKYPNKFVVVTGDFNAQIVLDGNTLYFHSKDYDPRDLVAQHTATKGNPLFVENPEGVVKNGKKEKPPFLGYMPAPDGRKITLGQSPLELPQPPVPTTNKIRIITTQLGKILKPVASAIDWCFVVDPKSPPQTPTIVNSVVKIGDSVLRLNPDALSNKELPLTPFAPATWCSDHFTLESDVTINGTPYKFGSLNILGESITGKKAYNVFEFIDEQGFRELTAGGFASTIDRIKSEFMQSFSTKLANARAQMQERAGRGEKVGIKRLEGNFDQSVDDQTMLEILIDTFFTDKEGNVLEDYSPKALVKQKVFGLVDAKYMNTHIPPFASADAKSDYESKKSDFLGSKVDLKKKEGESDDDFKKRVAKAEKELALKKIYVPYVADILQTGFFQKLYTEPGLDKIFSNWYGRLTSKQSYDDAIRAYLGRTSNKFDAFAMQEVSTKGMYDQLANAHIPGYCVQMEKSGDTTTGAILVRLPEGDTMALAKCVVARPRVQMLLMGIVAVLALVVAWAFSFQYVGKKVAAAGTKFMDESQQLFEDVAQSLQQAFEEVRDTFQDL